MQSTPMIGSQHYWHTYCRPAIYKPFIVLIVLFMFQQLSGGYAIIFYAIELIVQMAHGLDHADINEHTALIMIGVIRFVVSILTAM